MNKPRLIVTNVLVFVVTGLIAFVGVPFWAFSYGFDTTEIITTVVLFFVTGMSITAGYHRLWAHKTYEAHPVVKVFLAIGGAMAGVLNFRKFLKKSIPDPAALVF